MNNWFCLLVLYSINIFCLRSLHHSNLRSYLLCTDQLSADQSAGGSSVISITDLAHVQRSASGFIYKRRWLGNVFSFEKQNSCRKAVFTAEQDINAENREQLQ